MVQETGEQNAAFLRAIALGDDRSISSFDDHLASKAKLKLSQPAGPNDFEGGPLMQAIYAATAKLQVTTSLLCFMRI